MGQLLSRGDDPPAPAATPSVAPDFDLTDPDLYAVRVPHEELAELRRAAPVRWNPQPPDLGFNDDGFWAVTRHSDVVAVSRDSDTWSSEENGAIIRFVRGTTREQVELQRVIMLNIDPPQHTKLRGIVSRGFTPRAINGLRDVLAAAELVGYSMVMAADRRACPRDDIVTKLVHAQVDGGELTEDEFGFFVILLSVAGNETTRNAISHGMLAFL